jgi:hypothetical protein
MNNATNTCLLQAANDDLAAHAIVANLHRAIQHRMDRDSQAHGRFSRAYIAEMFEVARTIDSDCRPCQVDAEWIAARRAWLDAVLDDHADERRDARLTAARRAADGVVLEACRLGCDAMQDAAGARMRDALIAMTLPAH